MSNDFEPKILGIFCNWCSYAGADLAGISRLRIPANLRIIRVMCSGRVDPSFVLKAFQSGADGVFVSGCHPGDCHYSSGNYKLARRNVLIESLLDSFGIEKGRYRQTWISASEGDIFARMAREMVEDVRKLGPFPGLKGRRLEVQLAKGGE